MLRHRSLVIPHTPEPRLGGVYLGDHRMATNRRTFKMINHIQAAGPFSNDLSSFTQLDNFEYSAAILE